MKKSQTKKPTPQPRTGSRLKSANATNGELSDRATFFKRNTPAEEPTDPVEWANNHASKQMVQSMLELEYQLKFGDMKTRKELALEFLGFKGITKQRETNGQVVPAIQLIMNGVAPFTQVTIANKDPAKELVEGEIVPLKEKE